MEYGKYIIIEHDGCEFPILFHSVINHCDIGTKGNSRGKVISAGFFMIGAESSDDDEKDIDVSVWGKSVTLKIESRKEDERLIKQILRYKSIF